MSGCRDSQKVKYTAGSFVGKALTWWNSQIHIQSREAAAGTLTDEALRNGSIKKNPEKRGNGEEPSKDRNVRDGNKRTRTGNAFATTTNLVGRENMSTIPSVPRVALTIHLGRLVAHGSTVTTRVIFLRIIEWR
nr:hypothetical protein [Tanacetum cinerariifolium]